MTNHCQGNVSLLIAVSCVLKLRSKCHMPDYFQGNVTWLINVNEMSHDWLMSMKCHMTD
jgi:hypothetical protein